MGAVLFYKSTPRADGAGFGTVDSARAGSPCHRTLLAVWLCLLVASSTAFAQDRLKSMPGYEQYQKMRRVIPTAVTPGTVLVSWSEDGSNFEYRKDNKTYR